MLIFFHHEGNVKNYFLVWGAWGFPFHRMLNIIFGFVFQGLVEWGLIVATTILRKILQTMWNFPIFLPESKWYEASNYYLPVVLCMKRESDEGTQRNEINNSFSSPHRWSFLCCSVGNADTCSIYMSTHQQQNNNRGRWVSNIVIDLEINWMKAMTKKNFLANKLSGLVKIVHVIDWIYVLC